jgi:hypothetical protein
MIGEGESSRARVKTTLDKVYGREGDRLLAMLDPATLVGKSPREVFGSWIGQLQAAELPIREAAIAQLSAITGRDLSYSAESTSSQRNTVAGRWSKWLDSQTDEQLADLLPGSP